MNRFIAAALFAAVTAVASAQETTTESAAPATPASDSPASAAVPGGRPATTRDITVTTAVLERMWGVREKMYQDAGISPDRIQKLKDLEMQAFASRQRGEKLDMAEIRKQREAIITPEEQKKIEDARAQRNTARRGEAPTTGTAGTATAISAQSSDTATSPTTNH